MHPKVGLAFINKSFQNKVQNFLQTAGKWWQTVFWRQLKNDKSSSKTKNFLFFLKKEFKQDQASATKVSSFVFFFPGFPECETNAKKLVIDQILDHDLHHWMPMPTAIPPTLTSWAPYRRCSCAYNNLLKTPVKRIYKRLHPKFLLHI